MIKRYLGAALVVTVLVLVGCQGGDDAPEAAPLMTITNSWADEDDSAHTFDLVSDDDGNESGTFTGLETLPDFTQFNIAGSWADGAVTMTVFRLVEVVYEADYSRDHPTRLVFSSVDGDLVLVRDAGSPRRRQSP